MKYMIDETEIQKNLETIFSDGVYSAKVQTGICMDDESGETKRHTLPKLL